LALPFGQFADRCNRKWIVMGGRVCLPVRLAGIGGLYLFFQLDPLWVYGLLFPLAVSRAFSMPAMGALLSTLIPKEAWANGASWNSSISDLTGLVGPALAGL